jgi:hypothetical protein
MSSAGMCSVMQKIVLMPAPTPRARVGRAGGRDVDDARVGAGLAHGLGTVSKTGTRPLERGLAALAGRHAGHDVVP